MKIFTKSLTPFIYKSILILSLLTFVSCDSSEPQSTQSTGSFEQIELHITKKTTLNNLVLIANQSHDGNTMCDTIPLTFADSVAPIALDNHFPAADSLLLEYQIFSYSLPIFERHLLFSKVQETKELKKVSYKTTKDLLEAYYAANPTAVDLEQQVFIRMLQEQLTSDSGLSVQISGMDTSAISLHTMLPGLVEPLADTYIKEIKSEELNWSVTDLLPAELKQTIIEKSLPQAYEIATIDPSALNDYYAPFTLAFLDSITLARAADSTYEDEYAYVSAPGEMNFYISRAEISEQKFKDVAPELSQAGNNTPEMPITNVSFYEAILFCNKLSELSGLTPYYTYIPTLVGSSHILENLSTVADANGFRLPDLASIKAAYYANLIDTTVAFYWGKSTEPAVAGLYSDYNMETEVNVIHPSPSFNPNAAGIFNLHGNASEWLFDSSSEGRALTWSNGSDETVLYKKESSRASDLGFRVLRPALN